MSVLLAGSLVLAPMPLPLSTPLGTGGLLYSLLMTLLLASVVQIFLQAPWLHIAICAGGAALFSF